MPKKTRRQKALAQERKVSFLLRQTGENRREELRREVVTTTQTETRAISASYFIYDLRRSLLYVALIITLEIVVYFGTIKGYFGN